MGANDNSSRIHVKEPVAEIWAYGDKGRVKIEIPKEAFNGEWDTPKAREAITRRLAEILKEM